MQIEQIDRDAAAKALGYATWEDATDYRNSGAEDRRVAHMVQAFAAHRLAALSARPAVGEDVVERVQDMLVSAYKAGATAVHNSWVEGTNGSEPDFYEAASDYARAAIAAMNGEHNERN